jgi:hypothetical protein
LLFVVVAVVPVVPVVVFHLQLADDSVSELSVGSMTTKITSQDLSVSNNLQGSLLDLISELVKTHMSQHEDR